MDETAELQRKQIKVSIAQAYKNLGFKVEIDETGEFIYSQPEATEITTPLEQLSQEPLNQTSVRMSGEPADVHKNSDILVKNEDDEEIIKEFWDLALNAVKAGTLFETYEGLSKAKSKKINSILAEAMKDGAEFSVSALIDKMLKIGGLDQEQAEKIIRTEHQAVSNKARELAFLKRDPEGEYRYRWSVVHDHRTSQICKDIEHEINNRGGKVALEEMKEIQKRISKQHLGEDWEYRDFVPHINCRSKLVRVVE